MKKFPLAVLLLGFTALGHGANTQAYQVLPATTGRQIVATSLGAFFSVDDGQSWDWVCERATGAGRSPTPIWFASPSGDSFVFDFSGLSVSRDGLCTFDRIATFDATGVADMDSAGTALYAVTGRYGQTNGIYKSTDDGRTWSSPVVSSMTEFYASLRVSKSNPDRVYVAAWWFDPAYTMALYRSDNGGTGFTRIDLTTVMPELGAFYVHAVHPKNPDIVLGSLTVSRNPNPALLMRSTNGGATWTQLFETPFPVSQVAFSPDGQNVWAAAGNTTFASTDQGATFTALDKPTRDACVATLGSALYVCGNELIDGFVAARRTGTGSLVPFMNWGRVNWQRSCASGTGAADLCPADWPVVQQQIELLRGDADGGTGGGAGGSGGGGGGTPPGPCGCSSVFGSGAWLFGSLLILRKRRARVQSAPN